MLDLTNPATIQKILAKYNIAPNKFMGQNFLIDKNVLDKIIEAAEIKKGDNVLEIGPGLGTLTRALLAKGANVAAIEKDKDLIPVLEDNLREYKNLKIIIDDFLKLDFEKIEALLLGGLASKAHLEAKPPSKKPPSKSASSKYKVVSNIPYYITSPVIRKILSSEHLPEQIVFLLQREVAERIAAEPGKMSFISVLVQFYGTPGIVEIAKPFSFWPAPEIESAVLKITLNKKHKILDEEKMELWRLVKIGFSARRKTLANNLSAGFHIPREKIEEILKSLNFGEKIRAQELGVEEWIKLLKWRSWQISA